MPLVYLFYHYGFHTFRARTMSSPGISGLGVVLRGSGISNYYIPSLYGLVLIFFYVGDVLFSALCGIWRWDDDSSLVYQARTPFQATHEQTSFNKKNNKKQQQQQQRSWLA